MFKDRAIGTLAIAQTLVWAGTFYVFPALLLRWEAALGWGRADLMVAVSLSILTAGFASPLAGRLIDRGQGPAMMGVSTALAGLCLMLVAASAAKWQFYALWVLIGACSAGCLYDPCFALITRARGAAARQGITTITLVAGFASTLSFPLTHMLADAMGWRWALLCIGSGVVVLVAPLMWVGARALGDQVQRDAAPQTSGHDHSFGRHPAFWMLGLSFAAIALVHGAVIQHLLPILSERGVANSIAVTAAASIGAMQVVGRLVMLVLERQISAHQFVYLSFGAIGAAVLILRVAEAQTACIAGFVIIFGAAYGMISILRPVVAQRLLGQSRFGAKFGVLSLLYMICAAGSGYLGALIWHMGGYGLMLACLVGLSAGAVLLYFGASQKPLKSTG